MLFDINKQKSSAFIKLFITLSIVLLPTILDLLSLGAAVNLMFVISACVLLMHIKTNEKLHYSPVNIVFAVMIGFSLLSLIWVTNRSGQFTYIFAIALVWIFGNIIKEYFESNDSYISRRISYLFSISGTICAFYNFIYWITEIVPVAKDEAFSKGLGTADTLGIFSVVTIGFTLSLLKGNSGLRKVLILFSLLLQLFCFLMTESVVAWIFAFVISAFFVVDKKTKNKTGKKHFMHLSLIVGAYILGLSIALFNSENGNVFKNVCSYAGDNLFGAGGGFLTGSANLSSYDTLQSVGCGLFPYLFASTGIIGALVCIILVLRSLLFFLKNKNVGSAIGFILMISIMLLPLGNSISSILLVLGLDVYNEHCSGVEKHIQLPKKHVKNIMTGGLVCVVLMSVATILSMIEMKAKSEFENGNYSQSYDLCKIVTSIDWFDSDSNRIAAASIRNDENLFQYKKQEALELIDEAVENDSENTENYEEKANIYLACGDYESAAAQYRIIVSNSVVKDKYKLDLTNVLYMIVEENEKGSSATKRAYEEIIELANDTEDLVVKEKIMDVADKADDYIKGELTGGEENVVE